MDQKKQGFSSSLGFVLSAAGSAVGVGNIWRFPYLAAQDGGGLFILVYLILVLTFGFTLLTTDIAIGRRTRKNAPDAFASIHPKWGFLGKLTFLVPAIIITYYTVIGGWIIKYITVYLTGQGNAAAQDAFFPAFISSPVSSVAFMLIFLSVTALVVYLGVEKGIERFSKLVMPGLLILIIAVSIYTLMQSHTDTDGRIRTGLDGLAVYLIPNFDGLTLPRFMKILLDAMSQLFFSLSVSMGIMITYGSYVGKDINLSRAIGHIEFFDTLVALLAGAMIVPAVYMFSGTDAMASGPSLMFVTLPKVFQSMGAVGTAAALAFFVMLAFAAITSSVSIMETLVASCMDTFSTSRKRMCMIIAALSAAAAAMICLGYNIFYFELPLPNGTTGQLLDVMDYVSNSFLMPLISLLTCIFVGWVIRPKWIEEEMTASGHPFRRRYLYAFMIRFVAPVLMMILFLQALGLIH